MLTGWTGRATGLVLACLISGAVAPSATAAPDRRLVVGIVTDGPWARAQAQQELLRNEIRAIFEGDYNVVFPEQYQLAGTWTEESAYAALVQLQGEREVDYVIALGVLASTALSQIKRLSKPSIGTLVVNPEVQGFRPPKAGRSGVKNLSYLTADWELPRDLEAFRRIAPVDNIAVIGDEQVVVKSPALSKGLADFLSEQKGTFSIVGAAPTAAETLSRIPDSAQGVYLLPLPRMNRDEFGALLEGLIARKLPSFSFWGEQDVRAGVLAGLAPSDDFKRRARRIAISIQRMQFGEDASELSVAFSRGEQLYLNVQTSRALDLSPSFKILTEAELFGTKRKDVARQLTLKKMTTQAVEANLDLMVAGLEVAVSEQAPRQALAEMMPSLSVSTSGTVIDDDRAAASFGSQSEFQWSLAASLQQVFSERLLAAYDAQKLGLSAQVFARRQVELDVIQAAAQAYLTVLRTKALESLQKENLKRSRTHLDLARKRVSIGVAQKQEIYRWDIEVANGRADVIDANATRNQAEIEINRVLNRPLEESFAIADIDAENPQLFEQDPRALAVLDNPRSFDAFRDFMSQVAIKESPEIAQLDEAIRAQDRIVLSNERRFWLPSIGLQADLGYIAGRAGEGSDGGGLALPATTGVSFPTVDDLTWSVGVSVSLPLFEGTARYADLDQSRAEKLRLMAQRDSTALRIEQRLRSSAHGTGASFARIGLSEDAAEAAQKNLEAIRDAYARGAVSFLELIDAQNQALAADIQATDARYDFLIDLVELERASGVLLFTLPEEERKVYLDEMTQYFQDNGIKLRTEQ